MDYHIYLMTKDTTTITDLPSDVIRNSENYEIGLLDYSIYNSVNENDYITLLSSKIFNNSLVNTKWDSVIQQVYFPKKNQRHVVYINIPNYHTLNSNLYNGIDFTMIPKSKSYCYFHLHIRKK